MEGFAIDFTNSTSQETLIELVQLTGHDSNNMLTLDKLNGLFYHMVN
jgi:hypothetical protein